MIITNNEDLLRVKCEDVLPEEVDSLIKILEKELAESAKNGNPGIGLAAPQIGIPKKIAIIRMGDKFNINLVNCKIQNSYDPQLFANEGCLSFPGKVENTIRYQEVHITNNLVHPHEFVATGLLAVVCQHEIDHINGSLFLDRLAPKQKQIIKAVKVGPNEKCPCGSNLKYKKCCGR
jgi:peptide deformylase